MSVLPRPPAAALLLMPCLLAALAPVPARGADPAPPPAGEAVAGTGTAPEALTLEEALRIALALNRDVLKARELRNGLEGRYVAERSAALPRLDVKGDLVRSRDDSQYAFGGTPGTDTATLVGSVTQPLYTGGQVRAAIRAARVGIATADDALRIARQRTILDVSTAFHDVLLAREGQDIALENREQKRRLLDEARKKRAAGTGTDYDVLVAEVGLANAEPAVVRSENQIRTARERLRLLLGRGEREVDARGTLVAPVEPPPPFGEVLAAARANRPELSELRHRIGIGEELVVIARAGGKPRLDVRAGAGWKEAETGFGEADGSAWSAGLFASWALFDGFRARGEVARARSDVETLRIEEARLLDGIALEAREAVNALREAGEIATALAGTVGQAERLLELAQKGFEYGVKTKLEVDDAQLNLNQARVNLARARRDYLVSRVELEYVKGTLDAAWAGETPPEPEPFRPAASPLGVVREVVTGEPDLSR